MTSINHVKAQKHIMRIRVLCLFMVAIVTLSLAYSRNVFAESLSASINVNGKRSTTLAYGSDATLVWATSGFNECSVTPGDWMGLQGSESLQDIISNKTYRLTCTGTAGSATAYATFAVSPPTFDYLREFLKSAEDAKNRNELNNISWRVYDAKARYQSGRLEQSKKILDQTVSRVNKLAEQGKLASGIAGNYSAAVNNLSESWGKSTPVPDAIPDDTITAKPANGGYPTQWANAPMDSLIDRWGMYNRESVSYAAWKVYSTYGSMPYWGGVGNANQWPGNARAAGIPTDAVAQAGTVAIWNVGAYGHAMWVETVNPDGSIRVSQYNYDFTGQYSERVVSATLARTLTYIHFY